MSNTGVPVSQAELGETDRSMFDDIMGHELDDGIEQQNGQQPDGHEGDEPDNHDGEDEGGQGNRERDERGRFAARQEPARDGKDEPAKGDQPVKGETPAERGLRGELRSERDKRQAAEAAREADRKAFEERFKALEARMQQPAPQPVPPQAAQAAQSAPERVEDPMPDRWLDPEGYDAWKDRQFDRRLMERERAQEARRVEWSLQAAAGRYGDEFRQAHAAAERGAADPVTRAAMTRVLGSADPGEALIQWHRQQRVQAEIGSDPNAYRERLMQEQRDKLMNDPEFRRQVYETLRTEAQTGNNGSPRTLTEMPPSLNGARGSGGQRPQPGDDDNSERGIFRHAMS